MPRLSHDMNAVLNLKFYDVDIIDNFSALKVRKSLQRLCWLYFF